MKKYKLWTVIFGLVFVLAGCNDNTESDPDAADETAEDDSGETTEEATEETSEENGEETDSESSLSGEELTDLVQENWADTDSYELNQVFTIDSGDDSSTIRTITTHSDQNELKVDINNNDVTTTHYIVDGEHYIYSGDSLDLQPDEVNIDNTTYGDLVSRLDDYESGSVSESGEGYTLSVQIDDPEDAGTLLTEEAMTMLGEAEDFSGEVILTFDDEYMYDGGELTAVMTSGGEEIELTSTISIENVGNIPVIEKPSGM